MCIYPYTIFEACGHTTLHQRPISRCTSPTCRPTTHPYRSYRAYRSCSSCEIKRQTNISQAESRLHIITIPESRWRVRFNDPSLGINSLLTKDPSRILEEPSLPLTRENYDVVKASKRMERASAWKEDEIQEEMNAQQQQREREREQQAQSPSPSQSAKRASTMLAGFMLRPFASSGGGSRRRDTVGSTSATESEAGRSSGSIESSREHSPTSVSREILPVPSEPNVV